MALKFSERQEITRQLKEFFEVSGGGISITNDVANRLLTAGGDGQSVIGQANLTFNGTQLDLTANAVITTNAASNAPILDIFNSNTTSSAKPMFRLGVDATSSLEIFRNGNDPTIYLNANQSGNGAMALQTRGATRILMDADIGFYDSTVSSLDFYWESANSALSIVNDGTSSITSPKSALDVRGSLTLGEAPSNNILNNAEFGKIEFYSYDSNTDSSGVTSKIVNIADGDFTGSQNNFRFGVFVNDGCISTGTLQERLSISQNGNVGVGTTEPAKKLEISNNNTSTVFNSDINSFLSLENDNTTVNNFASMQFNDGSGLGSAYVGTRFLRTNSGGDLFFATRDDSTGGSAIRMTINDVGKVSINSETFESSNLNVDNEISVGSGADERGIINYSSSELTFGTRSSATNYFSTLRVKQGTVAVGASNTNALGNGGTPITLQVGGNGSADLQLYTTCVNGGAGNTITFGTSGASSTKQSATITSLLEAAVTTHATGNLVFGVNGGAGVVERGRFRSGGCLFLLGGNGTLSAYTSQEPLNVFGNGGGIMIFRNDTAAPTNNQVLGSLGFKGVDSANSNSSAEAKIAAVATENHSGSTAQTELQFYTKASGTGPGSAPRKVMTIDAAGSIEQDGPYLFLGGRTGTYNGTINNVGSVRINIDSNNSGTGECFVIGHNQCAQDVNNKLMQIDESGNMCITGNIYINKGSSTSGFITTVECQVSCAATMDILILASEFKVLEVFGAVDPNVTGSSAYRDIIHMYIYNGIGYNGAAVANYIYTQQISPIARTVYDSGSNCSGDTPIVANWYNGVTLTDNIANTDHNSYCIRLCMDSAIVGSSEFCVSITKRY